MRRLSPSPTPERHEPGGAVCSESAVPTDTWVHIGVNFGDSAPLTLYIDGIPQPGNLELPDCVNDDICGATITHGIEGNHEPWVIGASSVKGLFNSADNLIDRFDGAIDYFRISKDHRDF